MENGPDTVSKEKKFKYFGTIAQIAVIFFIGFSLYLLVSTIMLIFLTKPAREVKVPDVEGKKFVNVYNSLTRSGLRPVLKFRELYDMDDGIILSQYPESGRIVPENSNLKLLLSRSKISIDMPELINLNLPAALNRLKNVHSQGRTYSLGVGVISYLPSEKIAENTVMNQNPKPLENITPDAKVNLLVSAGKTDDGTMPEVTGQSIDLCFNLLLAKGLTVSQDVQEIQDSKLSGIVAEQRPFRAALLKKGDQAYVRVYWYPVKEHAYSSYERIDFNIPAGDRAGMYEALVEDDQSARTCYLARKNPGERINFVFYRTGNAKITILCDKKKVRVIGIDADKFK